MDEDIGKSTQRLRPSHVVVEVRAPSFGAGP
jgi:hypothetical protein